MRTCAGYDPNVTTGQGAWHSRRMDERFDYEWVKVKPRTYRKGAPPVLGDWPDAGWEAIGVTTRPGLLGGFFGTSATWILVKRRDPARRPSAD